MTRLLPFLLVGCAPHVPRMPGPLGPVAMAAPPPVHVRELPRDLPSELPDETVVDPAPPETESPEAPAPPPRKRDRNPIGSAVASSARHYLRHTPPKDFRNDCSGYVMAVYDRAGHPISGNSRSFWADAKERGEIHKDLRPLPGDIAFFDNTYDRNGNGRRDDTLTHVAVVMEVLDNGTIVMGHGGTSKGRTTLRMNLVYPKERHAEDGSVMNDWLRARRRGEPENGKYLAGQLFKGFARIRADGS